MKVQYFDLKDKRALVSGGASGIGASIVEHLCEQGVEVYFFDIDKIFNKNIYDILDHSYLNDIQGLDSPTTENIAKWLWSALKIDLEILKEVRVFENDVYGCIYKGD